MRERLSDYQEKYGDLYNLEATPAESTSYRLAKHDKERYPDIITANEGKTPYYTNSSHLPVGYTADILKRLTFKTTCKRFTPLALFSTPSWVKNLTVGRPRLNLLERLQKTINCHTTQSAQLIQCAATTATSLAKFTPAQTAEKKPRFTAELPATIVLFKTGTMARLRNLKIG